jgi:hypothetical protein
MAFFLSEKSSPTSPTLKYQWSIFWNHFKKPMIWKPALFMFVWSATPSSQSAYFYFLTNDIGFQVKIKNQKSKIKNQKSKIKNQKSKIKNQKSKIK